MEVENLKQLLELTRKELKNIRQELHKLKAIHEKDVKNMKSLLVQNPQAVNPVRSSSKDLEKTYKMCQIGCIESCFKHKNGIPRQPNLCPFSKALLTVDKSVFPNPDHSLIGLEEYSHVWILFIFHRNGENFAKAKVRPPRLDGTSIGVYSTRSPHRPNAIGLSLTKLEKIEGNTLYLSGVDLLDGTPVLDIKPYIPQYDEPNKDMIPNKKTPEFDKQSIDKSVNASNHDDSNLLKEDKVLHSILFENDNYQSCSKESSSLYSNVKEGMLLYDCHDENMDFRLLPEKPNVQSVLPNMAAESKQHIQNTESKKLCDDLEKSDCHIASWVRAPLVTTLNVLFTERAESDLQKFHQKQIHDGTDTCCFCLEYLFSIHARSAISDVLLNDPRSSYRRKKCPDRLYYFSIDTMHITCWFDEPCNSVEILRVLPCHK